MAYGETPITAIQDWASGNANGPKLRALQRKTELVEAEKRAALAQQALDRAKKDVVALSPIDERRQLDAQNVQQQYDLLGPASAKANLDLRVRGERDALDINREKAQQQIATASDITKTDNLYGNLTGLVQQQGSFQDAARDAYIGENADVRSWISSERAAAQQFAADQLKGNFLDRLSQTAQALAPFVLGAIALRG
jgi:hypothetical protein